MLRKWRVLAVILAVLAVVTNVNGQDTRAPLPTVQRLVPMGILQLVPQGLELGQAKSLVDHAHGAGFTAIQILIGNNISLTHQPWQALPDAWSKEALRDWVAYVYARGMEVIPEVRLLTHQNRFFQDRHPELMFNKSTYDPRKEETYVRVFALLDEIIETVHPLAIHIGHDEVAGHNAKSTKRWLRPGEKVLPADLFLQDVLRIHAYLKQRGIETWMWGDMLQSPDEFPTMSAQQLRGKLPGYGKALRDKLPKDIVICNGSYWGDQLDFPSLSVIQKEGFRVIGVTFKKEKTIRNFSRYAAAHGGYGMLATTWSHVRKKEWDVVERIIRVSGEAFRKDFPPPSP